jgi:hypothetical protein
MNESEKRYPTLSKDAKERVLNEVADYLNESQSKATSSPAEKKPAPQKPKTRLLYSGSPIEKNRKYSQQLPPPSQK